MSDGSGQLVTALRSAGVVQFGDYYLKSGQYSPVYVDCRVLISSPHHMSAMLDALWSRVESSKLQYDYVCGVPHGAVPYASVLSVRHGVPMLMRRKEVKDYGTKKRIEGVFDKGKKVLVLEDVTTSGSSIMETVEVLRAEGLQVTDAIVLIDRGQGAQRLLAAGSVDLHPVLTLSNVLEACVAAGELTRERAETMHKQLVETTPQSQGDAAAQAESNSNKDTPAAGCDWSLQARLDTANNAKVKQLMQLMVKKQSNLCVAADFTKCSEVLELARAVGDSIVLFKTHATIIEDFTLDFAQQLRVLANDMHFMIFEDRKYDDTARTVELELSAGVFAPCKWADFVTVHTVAGAAALEGCVKAHAHCGLACLVVAEMSVDGALAGNLPGYTQKSVELAGRYEQMVAGFICQRRCSDNPSMLYITPGVHVSSRGDAQLQRWRTPHEAVARDRNDIVVVGRGVTMAKDRRDAAATYRLAAWSALHERIDAK